MDAEGHLKRTNEPAFCFFPTKEVTNLNFVLHAPFLLTDSREGIRAGVEHNDTMIGYLADLAADSFEYLRDIGNKASMRLIDDNIVTIIPVNPDSFSDPTDKRKVSFLPFYQTIKEKFAQAELLPSTEGYVSSRDAYWASVPQLPLLFTNKQLGNITENENAHWVFSTLGRDEVQRNNPPLFSYVDSLVRTNISEDVIIGGRSRDFVYIRGVRQSLENIKGIDAEFTEKQTFEWLHRFYKWLSETKHRRDICRTKPVFLDQNRKAVAAFDSNDQLILFLPVNDISGYTVVHPELLKNQETRQFIEDIGIKRPSLRDQIYNIILPQYQGEDHTAIDVDAHFQIFFRYYCKCSNDEVDEFIELVKPCDFLVCDDKKALETYRGRANSMYFPTAELTAYFETKKGVRFIALDKYRNLAGPAAEKQLISFLTELGVKKEISIVPSQIDYFHSGRDDLPFHRSTRGYEWKEKVIDGCKEIVEYIVEHKDASKSAVLWNSLLRIINSYCNRWNSLEDILKGTFEYFYYSPQQMYFTSSAVELLRESPWLENSNGEFVSPSALHLGAVSDIYEMSSECIDQLLDFLNISDQYTPENDEVEDDSHLTETQREKIAFADKLKEYGIENEDDLAEFQEYRRQKDAAKRESKQQNSNDFDSLGHSGHSDYDGGFDYLFDGDDGNVIDVLSEHPERSRRKVTAGVIKDIARRTKGKPFETDTPATSTDAEDEVDVDEDEFMPSPVDYSKKIERAKERSAAEIDKIAYFKELHDKALKLTQEAKYSVAWFNTLLEMESINSGEANANSKEVSISFARVEREAGTERTLVLRYPNRYIPQFMEDLADIPLILHFGEQKKTVAIEVANIKSYTLRVKMKNSADVDGVDLSSVTAATIDAKSPVFLLEELRKQFAELGLEDDFNLKDNLCENIEFVFGPPGTGKTTYLARNVLIPMMKHNSKCRVLVLTPTNKAADVLVKRIMEVSGAGTSYTDWLVRFGGTVDEEIEQSPVFRDKTFDIRTLDKNVTITTIARFPYDFFMPHGARVFLRGMNWDYIVIDEASMIPIANIVFPLYKKTPRKFIVAGDPFQIEPITSVDLWKNENIYTMVELNSFVSPKTKPHQYKVELLTTQYRSVPAIGELFSKFAYGGVLKHCRTAESQRRLNIEDMLGIKTLNIIKYPVSKYESIYRAKRLQHSSSYQVYSALFTFEYVCYLSRSISANNPGNLFKIGVIAPYRAQADLIDKLLASEKLPAEVEVQVGTIHGFQGDECDIIFAVFNTPPSITSAKETFLNKRNIINVSISRARDYLFVVMPDDNTEGISNLRLVKRIEKLVKNTDTWNEFLSPDMERLMFGDANYLEINSFSTGHQSVNVYGLPERRYEIRTEDNAVDVQIHRNVPDTTTSPVITENSLVRTSDTETQHGHVAGQNEQQLGIIPKELKAGAIEVEVFGACKGKYYLIPYKGKLKNYTQKEAVNMFIPQTRSGKEKLVPVSVIEEDHLIYIPKENYKAYEKI